MDAGSNSGRGSTLVRAVFGLQTAVRGVLSHKLRSALTVLGVAIGVASLIVLLAIGNGAREAIARQFESLGTNLVKVSSHRWDVRLFTSHAEEMVERVPTVTDGMALLSEDSVDVHYRRLAEEFPLRGVGHSFPRIRDHQLLAGRFFGPLHVEERMRVAVLGHGAWRRIFGSTNPVGEGIYVEGQRFTVVGVLEPKGAGMADDVDGQIIVPVTAAQRVLLTGRVDELWFQSPDEESVEAAMVQLGRIFRSEFNIDEEGVVDDGPAVGTPAPPMGSPGVARPGPHPPGGGPAEGPPLTVTSLNTMVEEAGEATRVMTMMLGGIASVALLVGGLGIMNIMLVSVGERTREIGIRKALGAHPLDVVYQFMVEALLLGLVGGILGLSLGLVGTGLAEAYGLETLLTADASVVAFVAAVTISVIFGVYPAFTAAQLQPVDALRHR